MNKVLDEKFFAGDAVSIAESLLGKYLVRSNGEGETALMLNEVEAYDGPSDKACHASKGMTPRTEIMFGDGGFFYVYFVYGIHWMLNIVVGKKDYPAAVLLRGAGDVSGPARLTKFLKVDKAFNKKKAEKATGLWFEDRGVKVDKPDIIRTPRIGVDYAGKVWSKKPYRFVLKV
jgi:DNA-3-methyladenine glycosylase